MLIDKKDCLILFFVIMLCTLMYTTTSSVEARDIYVTLGPGDNPPQKVHINSGEEITFILTAKSGYKIHNSSGTSYGSLFGPVSGYHSPPTKKINKYQLTNASIPGTTAAIFCGDLVRIGHGGGGELHLIPFEKVADSNLKRNTR